MIDMLKALKKWFDGFLSVDVDHPDHPDNVSSSTYKAKGDDSR